MENNHKLNRKEEPLLKFGENFYEESLNLDVAGDLMNFALAKVM